MYKLCFYVPESHLESVKTALFNAGAGTVLHYQQVCWQCLGTGQFMPLESSNPTIGKANTLEHVSEYKVEMICKEEIIKPVIQALLESHPYESPAYDVLQLIQIDINE